MKNESRKKTRKWPWVVLGVIIVMIIGVSMLFNGMRSRMSQTIYNSHIVSPGSVEISVTGSGKLEPTEVENIALPEGIKVNEVLVEVGDVIEEGQMLAELNPDFLHDQVASLMDEISSLDKQLTQMNDSKTIEYVYAPVKGRIKYIAVEVGDDVTSSIAEHGALAILSTDGKMHVEIQTDAVLDIYTEVTVKWNNGEKKGKLASKTAIGYRITLTDNGTPYGEEASVYDGETLLGSGTIQVNKPIAVYGNGGTIDKIHYGENKSISANTKLFTLDNEPFTNSYQQTYSQRQDLAEQLQTLMSYMESPYVLAENKGTVSQVLISDGDTTANAGTGNSTSMGSTTTSDSGKTTAFVINKSGELQMNVAVDELDISSMKLNQVAEITLDAISSETFGATVTRISYLGVVNGNITTYNVELTLESDERFLAGMNGNATIIIDEAEEVLLVPIEAINEDATGIYVYVSESGAADGSDRQRRDITTGLSDGEYAEITDGLTKGEIVQYVKAVSIESLYPMMPGRQRLGGTRGETTGGMPDNPSSGSSGGGGGRSGN